MVILRLVYLHYEALSALVRLLLLRRSRMKWRDNSLTLDRPLFLKRQHGYFM